jgi:AcrR family transcriptional regulator
LDATEEILATEGSDALTVRAAAARAGVAHTTAYRYFVSKEHLAAQLHLRLQTSCPLVEPDWSLPMSGRIAAALAVLSDVYAGRRRLAHGVLDAITSSDPEIVEIRLQLGEDLGTRVRSAAGPDADPRVVEGVLLMFVGAMLEAGLGFFEYDDVVRRIAHIVELWDPASPS